MKKQILKSALMAVVGVGLLAGSALALTVNVTPVNGTTNYVNSIDSTAAGSDAVGMDVAVAWTTTIGSVTTAHTQTFDWAALGSSYGITNGDFSIIQDGNTYTNQWNSNIIVSSGVHISTITFDAMSGGIIFDTDYGTSTNGSDDGTTFTALGTTTYTGTINVTYKDRVALIGDTPKGDVFRYMTLEFNPTFDNFASNGVNFMADTDKFAPVPEPATMLLFGAGIAGLAGIARRRKTN